ncbi:hypothetical protein SLEP1_g36101 [Rubroshorea leprosula]|nr:hypothetical protein SLEP1_g36101 [Rubroshorea leprosula]
MTVNKNRPLKWPFEEAEWENAPITFSPVDYKRADGEPNVMMPHADPFVATVHIGNHNVNKVFIDIGSSPDILYWSDFQKMQLNPSSLQKYEGPIYGFDNQPVPVEGVNTLPIYVGSEPRFRMASVSFLVVKMESAFNAILGKATMCELKAVIPQPHLCMKFSTPQGVGVLKGNQKIARAYYQDTFKKVELATAPKGSFENHRPTQLGQQTMNISDIEHRPEGVEQKAESIEPVEAVPLNPDVPKRTLTVHKLSTNPTKRSVVQKRHLFGPEKQAAIDEKIQKLLQAGFIRRVEYSEWVSNPVLIKKPNGKWRMCIDFTNLNEACPKDPHPLPNVEKLVERAARHERMSFLDTSSGYHQVQLLLDDQEKTAFYTGDAIYCYVMIPFGLKNAGVTYQKLVQVVFKLQIGRNIEVYVDDIIVTSKRAEDHIDDLNETFQNLRRTQMKLNPLKCTFAVESGKFLRYVVSKKGIEVNPEKVQAVQQMEPPKTAFDELKRYLASAPLLSKPKEGESLYLYLGVTDEAVSSILLREENKHQKPICYVSKVLQGAEQNYSLVEKAVFALVYTAHKLRAYFQSHQIVVYTDLPLRKILQKPELSGWLIGWSVELSEYDLKFQPRTTIKRAQWKKGSGAGAANIEGLGAGAVLVGSDGFKSEHALRFKFQTTNNAVEYEALIYGLKLESELKVQSIQVFSNSQLVVGQVNGSCEIRDPQLGRYASVVNGLKSGFVSFQIDKIPEADNQRADKLSKLASSQDINPRRSTIVELDHLAHRVSFQIDKIPKADNQRANKLSKLASSQDINPRRSIIVEVLDAPSYTDFTIECQLLSTDPSSPSWTTPLIEYLRSGELPEDPSTAKLIKRRAAHFTLLDNQLYKTHRAMSKSARLASSMLMISICQGVDLLGPFVKGKGGCTYLVVAVDYFTKWIEAKLLSTTTEKKIEEFLFNSILCRFGIPKWIIADNGPQFRAAALRLFCNDYGIEFALTFISATGETPFRLAYGAKAVILVKVILPSDRAGQHNNHSNEQLLRENLDFVEEVKEMSRIRNMAHQSRVARFYNKRVRARQFQVGNLVLCKAGLTNAYSHMGKLAPNWEGPYMVICVKRLGSYQLADLQGHPLPFIWNIHNLRKFYS